MAASPMGGEGMATPRRPPTPAPAPAHAGGPAHRVPDAVAGGVIPVRQERGEDVVAVPELIPVVPARIVGVAADEEAGPVGDLVDDGIAEAGAGADVEQVADGLLRLSGLLVIRSGRGRAARPH